MDCAQVIYNLGLVNVRLDLPEEVSQDFYKSLTVVPDNIFVIYQIYNLYDHQNELNLVTKFFNVLVTHPLTDPDTL